jgi:hypothetical protein
MWWLIQGISSGGNELVIEKKSFFHKISILKQFKA